MDTSTVVTAQEGRVVGLTGRSLVIPESWTNPTGQFNIGVKNAFDLYPRGWGTSRAGIVQERQEKYWDKEHKDAQATALRKQQEQEGGEGEELSLSQKLGKENAEVEVEMVAAVDKKARDTSVPHWLSDVGPVFDCLVWHTGEGWRAAIDTSEQGDLAAGLCLGVYRETLEYGKLSQMCQVNVSVNVWSEGNLLEIVSMPSSHGTHVASIAAANFPENPEKNGLAPGAQIVSINIGDSRLSSMETGTALVRAMSHIMRAEHYKVDVINMSYGEHSHWSSSGRVGELMAEVIHKHNVCWVASAGNDGPALCTVGTPPDINTSAVIGVGAYVSPEMMTAMYSSREKLPGTPFTWSSRGPTIDGDRGVTVCAPGGAITSVPQFTMRGTQLMNGTSMASPHVAGALGLLLSGLRAQGLGWSPFSMKRALANTAVLLEDNCRYGQGHGLLNIEKAYEHLVASSASVARDVHFAVTCGGGSAKGIHLRGLEAARSQEVAVKVEPLFLDQDNRPAADKQGFNRQFVLTSSAPWVSHPTHLDLMYCARHFLLQVDPTGLPPGAHSAFISAHDTADLDGGKVWEVAVTVVRTEPLVSSPRPQTRHTEVFQPGTIKRHFLAVPRGATWATFEARNRSPSTSGKFVLHTVQLLPSRVVRTLEYHKMFSLTESGDWTYSLPVRGGEGQVLEVCLAKWWANLGTLEAEYSVTFRGVLPSPGTLVMHGGEGLYRIDLETGHHLEEAAAEIKLKSMVQVVRPGESKVVGLRAGNRDHLPEGRHTFELQLSYSFSLAKPAEVVLSLGMLSQVLYESELESQLWMVYDGNKRLLGCGDAYPGKWNLKLEKGDFTVRAHVRHEKRELVEKFSDTPLTVSSKLASPLSPEIYSSCAQAQVGGKKCTSLTVVPGRSTPVWVAPLNTDKQSKGATLGQYLTGTATFAKDEAGKKVDVYSFKYILPDGSKKKDKAKDKDAKKKPEDLAAFEEALRDTKISWLAKLSWKSKEGQDLYSELLTTGGESSVVTSVHAARLTNMLAGEAAERSWDQVVEQAEAVVGSVDQPALLAWLGMKVDTRDNAVEVKKEMEKVKGQLVDALAARGEGLVERGEQDTDKLLLIYTDLLKYTDVTDVKVGDGRLKT